MLLSATPTCVLQIGCHEYNTKAPNTQRLYTCDDTTQEASQLYVGLTFCRINTKAMFMGHMKNEEKL
jgi:hypothetical protein